MDVDTRLLRYFVTVAEEGNLTRAAERLFVSQPALTKQIRQLENRLGVRLFTRSRAGMALTEPGRALAERAPALLDGWDDTWRATRAADRRAARVLHVGYLASAANEATPRIIAAFGRRRPDWRVEMRQTPWSVPAAGLADGAVDVALVRLPFPGQDGFRTRVLLTEPRHAVLPATHPLAARETISFQDLRDEPFIAAPPETGDWRDHWLGAEGRDGRPARVGAVAEQTDDWLSAVANGLGVALAPASAARFYARPGIVYRPVDGVAPSRVAVAWPPAADANPIVRDFVVSCLEEASGRERPAAGPG
ncbi:LysR family transcriptional regulator [Actinomadura algeriensis]|uniref:DNA-binding transcriptional LysR family regulator n=1 Tax=Actinomadura algeriensis TaxID=1679523 RepID=A0ABR9JTV9_9ACTN|nr:LysR family transcriptional regulator [Actinomadura algeriensis]MBE1534002.1 DNA-binding transcriptional LysR family regulator [Actinomadura algeriensis]